MRYETKMKPHDVPIGRPVQTNVLQRTCSCGQPIVAGGECATCQAKREAATLQRKAPAAEAVTTTTNAVPRSVHDVLASSGQPLDSATRAFMEPRFGHDFSGVRVHTDAKAAQSARAVNAHAYTVGSHVAFAGGQYAPQCSAGRKLLAHELVHVVQQKNGTQLQKQLEVGRADTAAEHEAERVANTILSSSGRKAAFISEATTSGPLIQRVVPSLSAGDGCAGKSYRSCVGQQCNGRRGRCTWYGIEQGCKCRDTSEGGKTVRFEVPHWLAWLVGAAVVSAIVACFASGVCEFGAVVAGLGAGAAAAVIALLHAAGVMDSGKSAGNDSSNSNSERKVMA